MKRLILFLLLTLLPPTLAVPPLFAAEVTVEAGAPAAKAIPLKQIDWRHILSGQINTHGQATGFHYAGVDFVPRTARVVKAGKPDKKGVVKARIELFDPRTNQWIAKKSSSTLFPSNWTRSQLESEVEAAYGAAKLSRMLEGGSWSWRGASPSGITVQGVVDQDGTIRTAYPLRD